MRTRVLAALSWAGGAKAAGQLVNWAITLYVIRLLSPEDYGLMALGMLFVSVLAPISHLGLGAALVQREAVNGAIIRKTFGFAFLVSSILTLILFLGSSLIATIFEAPVLAAVVRVLSFSFIISSTAVVQRALLQKALNFKAQSLVDMVAAVLGGALALVLATNGFGVWSLVWSYLVTLSIGAVGVSIVSRFRILPDFDLRGISEVIQFGTWETLSSLTWMLWTQADVVIIGRLLGQRLLGFYSVSKHVAQLPQTKVQGVLNAVAFPAYSMARASGDNPTRYFAKYIRLASLVAFPVFVGISCVAPEFVSLVLTEKWNNSTVPLQVIALGMPLKVLEAGIAPYLSALGYVRTSFVNMLFGVFLMVSCLLVGASYGLVGISVAWSVSAGLIFLVALFRATKVTDVSARFILLVVARISLPSILMYALLHSVRAAFVSAEHVAIHLFLLIVVGVVTYGMSAWLICRAEVRELFDLVGPRPITTLWKARRAAGSEP